MSTPVDRLFQQAVSSAQGLTRASVTAPRVLGIRPAEPRTEVFLYLESENLGSVNAPDHILRLRPGETYKLTVVTISSQENGEPFWRTRGNGLVLTVTCPKSPDLVIAAEVEPADIGEFGTASVLLKPEHLLKGAAVEFRIEVPPTSPRCRATLDISCSHPGMPQSQEPLLRRNVEIMGEEEAWTAQEEAFYNVDLSYSPPTNVICLHIQENQKGRLSIQGFHKTIRLEIQEIQKPDLSLARFLEDDGKGLREIVARVFEFSRERIGYFQRWLKEIRARQGTELVLIIMDWTDAEIPWELIRLADGQFLGALAEVVRWPRLWNYEEEVRLHLQPKYCIGNAVEYLDVQASPHYYEEEKHALGALKAESIDSPQDLLKRLNQGINGIGILYLGCHGAFVYPEREAERYQRLFSEADPDRAVVSLDFEFVQDPQGKIPIVFVNACHSGRLRGDGESLYGLPMTLLRFAEGYVGTLGIVSQKQAAQIGARLLRTLRENKGSLRVSEFLRRVRSEAAAAFDPFQAGDAEWQTFFFTFVYVYYGNPLIYLKINAGQRGEEDHENN